MKNSLFKIKSTFLNIGYKVFVKPVFFLQDPERVHDNIIVLGSILGRIGFINFFTKLVFNYETKILETNLSGIKIKNPKTRARIANF